MWAYALNHGALSLLGVGAGKTDGDAAAVRANHPIPPQCGLYYFEVEIVSKGRDGYIGIGFCAGGVLLNRLPGWEATSWGYHGDDGHSFDCSGTGKAYGPKFTTGDIIGCGVNMMTSSAFYTKNGVHLGTAFKDLPIAKLTSSNGAQSPTDAGLTVFPCIGLRTPGEQVEVNFGAKKFKFDIESYFKASIRCPVQLGSSNPHSVQANILICMLTIFTGRASEGLGTDKCIANIEPA